MDYTQYLKKREKDAVQEVEDSEDSKSKKSVDEEQAYTVKRLKDKAKEEAEALLARDNLKIKSLAKYKTIRVGKLEDFLNIDNDQVDLAFIKGRAFEDSSMEEKERSI